MAARVYVAKETIHLQTKTGAVTIHKGERIREGHEYMRGREASFVLETRDVMYDVEQATKSPGERRGERGVSEVITGAVKLGEKAARVEDDKPKRGAKP